VTKKTTIYKYVSAEDLDLILNNKNLKFSIAKRFNDPFDCYPELISFNVTESFLTSHIEKGILVLEGEEPNMPLKDLIPHVQSKYYNHSNTDINALFEIILNKYRFSCFSLTNKQILMWSHYANKHTGACIGFNVSELMKIRGIIALKVNYTQEFDKSDMCKDELAAIQHLFSTKSIQWDYEEEIRLLTTPEKADEMDSEGLMPFSTSAVSEVYFGCQYESNTQLKKLNFERIGYEHVKFKRMLKSKRSFELESINI